MNSSTCYNLTIHIVFPFLLYWKEQMISPEQKKIQSFFLTFKLFEEELKARREKYARSL